jgi:hypothetical protein
MAARYPGSTSQRILSRGRKAGRNLVGVNALFAIFMRNNESQLTIPVSGFWRASRILLAPAFLIALSALLLNDLLLKHAYPGWVTGKLSDFAGLFVVSGLVLTVAPQRPRWLLVLLGAIFAWWKSAESQWLIDLVNVNDAGLRIGRVVDMTDLLALPMLPLGAAMLKPELRALPRPVRPLATGVCAIFVVLALSGTSLMPVARSFSMGDRDTSPVIDAAQAELIVARVAKEFDMSGCTDCDEHNRIVYRDKEGITLSYRLHPNGRQIEVYMQGGLLPWFSRRNGSEPTLNALRERVRRELTSAFPNTPVTGEFETPPPPVRKSE